MIPGLVNSPLIDGARPTRPTIQVRLIPDPEAECAELRELLRQSEAAYDGLCDTYQQLVTECDRLRHLNTQQQHRIDYLEHEHAVIWRRILA